MAIKNVTAEHERMKQNEIVLARLFLQQCCGQLYGEHAMVPVNHQMFAFWSAVGVVTNGGQPDEKQFAEHIRLFADLIDPPSEAP
jgi:hypothetical protein